LKEDTIISNCFAFLLAGAETTSTALAYTAWLLAKHQDVQEKLHEEINATHGNEVTSITELRYDVIFGLNVELHDQLDVEDHV
jgi:cytochrome P450